MEYGFWKGKRVLVTGHTGFKGSWLCIWLLSMGADVIGYALEPNTKRDNYVVSGLADRMNDIRGDIRDAVYLRQVFEQYQPEIVFHLAAQPLVLTSYENPYDTYEINVMGTLNVLEAIRFAPSVHAAIMVTTDKCYENRETLQGYKETDPFGGYDPYSSSKACDEILIASYRSSYFPLEKYEEHRKAIATVRAGNVIGGGDWAKNRIVPDCIRSLENDEPVYIRNRYSVRPWQHVLEPLGGYLLLAEKLSAQPAKYSGGWNFGPNISSVWTVWDLAGCVIEKYGKGSIEDGTKQDAMHEAGKLLLNIDKAKSQLGWEPRLDVETAVRWTAEWYKRSLREDMYEVCMQQIRQYENLLDDKQNNMTRH